MASYSDNEDVDDQDWDEFEDAVNDIDLPTSEGDMTLGRAVEESQRAINYFFNNQFIEAKNLMTP
jgi:hypothetical protein